MRYNTNDLYSFWEKGKKGRKLTQNLIKDVKTAKKHGFTCVVVHSKGQEYNKIGENRLKKVLKICEKKKIPLAIENISCGHIFFDIFKNIKSEYLKFCLDVGHNNCLNKDYDYLGNYGNQLIALHLHNNDGTSDQHTINGNIDWEKLGKKLKNHKELSLDFELLPRTITLPAQNFLQEAKRLADNLEKYIEE